MNIPAPTYTQMPNVFLDEYARQMTEAELRIALVIMRNTFGWHRESHRMSLSYLQTATGMSRQGVINGIEGLTEKNIAGRRPSGNSYEYFLVVNEVDQNECSSQRSRPVASQRSRPNKESKKESISAAQVSDDDKDQRKQFPGELMLVLHGVHKDGWKTVNKQTWQQVHSHSKRMWDNGIRASDLHRYMAWRKQNESWKTSRPRPSEIETWFASEDNPANVPVREQIVEVWEWT